MSNADERDSKDRTDATKDATPMSPAAGDGTAGRSAAGDAAPERPRPWPKLGTRRGEHMILFLPRWDRLQNPRTGEAFDRLVLETPDWVNVVAITRDQRLVCVRQFRFGTATVTLEIPGGVIDRGEEHEQAARRELREETGYTSSRWRYLGAVEPNPAFHDNLCHHWLAEDCDLTHPQGLDPGEDISIDAVPLGDVVGRIESGEMRHCLVISALSRVLDLRPR